MRKDVKGHGHRLFHFLLRYMPEQLTKAMKMHQGSQSQGWYMKVALAKHTVRMMPTGPEFSRVILVVCLSGDGVYEFVTGVLLRKLSCYLWRLVRDNKEPSSPENISRIYSIMVHCNFAFYLLQQSGLEGVVWLGMVGVESPIVAVNCYHHQQQPVGCFHVVAGPVQAASSGTNCWWPPAAAVAE